MNHQDHVNLLRKGIDRPGGMWADLGSGGGAFTLALADLIGPEGMIYSVDKSAGALREQEREMRARFPETSVRYIVADFTRKMDLPPLDGVVMANSLHYVKQKDAMLQLVRSYLSRTGASCSWSTMSTGATCGCRTRFPLGHGKVSRAKMASPARNCWQPFPAVFLVQCIRP